MKEEAEGIFRALKSEVIDLHLRWIIYRRLFAGSEADVEILNRSGSNVFYLLQGWILDDVTLRLAMITDPPVQGKFENLSQERLSASLEGDSRDFVERELRPVLVRLVGACEALAGDDTQVDKQFVEDESVRRLIGDMVHAMTSQPSVGSPQPPPYTPCVRGDAASTSVR